jgi:hypothetical protein
MAIQSEEGLEASIFSAISSILVTLFQLRPVPEVPSTRSMAGHGNLDRPWPLGK